VASMMTGLLLSPAFLFRVDTTVGSGPNPKAWDAYTLADRLSYLLWNSAPDASLWQAAQDNSLMQPSVYEAQVQRLLSDPRSDDALFEFFHDVLQLDGILTAQKDPNIYTPQLAQDLYTQAAMTIKDLLLTQNADYRELFVSQDFFVNANLAARYGFTPVRGNDFVKMHYTANDRAGLFGLPGITTMLSPSARTSPTKRGIYIRGALMCTPIPSPPATANTTVTADANNPRTMRQLMIEHATNPECSGCHSLMDPLGFALDDFDWLGAYRSNDQGLPLDLSGSLNGKDFVNARTFGRALHDDVFVTQCLVTKFLLHATASAPDPTSPSVLALNQAFAAQGYRIKELVREFVMSPAFTQAP